MVEKINYYEILRVLENLLYKIQSYKTVNNDIANSTTTRINELRLEALQYIFSIPILKNEFINKVNEYIRQRETPNFNEAVERFKNKILELYYNEISISQKILAKEFETLAHNALTQSLKNTSKSLNKLSSFIDVTVKLEKTFIEETENSKNDDIDNFLSDCLPEIFYYPKITATKNNYQLSESIRLLYADFNHDLSDYLINTPLEYYIITYNYSLPIDNFQTLFNESYMMTALWKVIDDLYSFIDKQCRGIYIEQAIKLDNIDLKLQDLTPTQRKVCKEIVKGNSVNTIGKNLKSSNSTIREHIRQACIKLSIEGSPGIKTLKKYLNIL